MWRLSERGHSSCQKFRAPPRCAHAPKPPAPCWGIIDKDCKMPFKVTLSPDPMRSLYQGNGRESSLVTIVCIANVDFHVPGGTF